MWLHHLQLLDSALPVGAFAHSFGLESAVQDGRVRDRETLREWIETLLWNSWAPGDAMAINGAYGLNQRDLWRLDQRLHAARAARESREGMQKMGRRLMVLAREIHPDLNWPQLKNAIENRECVGAWPTVYGWLCRELEIENAEAVQGFLYSNTVATLNNAVRLLVLGQTGAQVLASRLMPQIDAAQREFSAQNPFDFWTNVPMADCDAMRHETLYSRLFMS